MPRIGYGKYILEQRAIQKEMGTFGTDKSTKFDFEKSDFKNYAKAEEKSLTARLTETKLQQKDTRPIAKPLQSQTAKKIVKDESNAEVIM